MVFMRPMAEVQAEDICPCLEEPADGIRARARWPEGGDDFRVSLTAHASSGDSRRLLWTGDQDRAEVVDVGEGRADDDLVADGLEEAVPIVVGEPLLGLHAHRRRTREA